jgi:peptidoglycan/xylan/chitin deacetylase (PgdA/CDA1 family)/CelD/BcsL family acetyltransferase involved in cellulose biosynthesis
MKITETRDRAGWERLQPLWNPLLAQSASATTFLTWEWLTAWWSAYGRDGDLRILTAVDDDGRLRGLAPLRRQTARRYGQDFRTLTFVGDGSGDSDYLDFIVARGFEHPVMGAFVAHLARDLSDGVMLQLNEVPAGSPNLQVLRQLTEAGHVWSEEPVPCATVHLPGSWDEYLTKLRPRFRTKVRSVLRNLEGREETRFAFCKTHAEVERLLPALFDLHTRRWTQDGKPGVFGWDRKRQFYTELSPLLLDRDSLRFSCLEWQGRILACQYGFVSGSTYLHLQEGYEPMSEHWNVGIGLRAWSMRELLRQGITEYDSLAGVGRHKLDWGAEVKESRRVVVGARTYRNLLFCRGPVWEERAKESVKKLIPEPVLAARRARFERPLAPTESSSRGAERIRRAAATCYLRLGVPAAARLVRERYQVSVFPGGGMGRLGWTRRREPAGRILYYHRVNDERDPFYPSMPVDVFERQMRFVARRYRVVSLARLIQHLESGAPGTLLAITFDDGYRDNYENAFPILQRYGLAATIFLSTGSLDTGDPLWFEVLSGAVKTTPREFLDVETDIPRRFWMRTPDERLRANGELFALLRHMPEDERRQRLQAILRELAAPSAGLRRDMMLSWDQVRRMKQHGIDFGGHTVTHPFLSRLTRDQVSWEVSECKRRIEAELQAPVSHFAYPNGREEDFGPWNKELLRQAGYEAALSTIWGLNYQSTDRMELRRGQPWEEDEAVFAYKMDWYQLVNG